LSDLGVFGGGLGISVADLRAGGQVFPGVARRAVQTGAVRSVALRCDPNEGAGGCTPATMYSTKDPIRASHEGLPFLLRQERRVDRERVVVA
jgi:hypothetical protein